MKITMYELYGKIYDENPPKHIKVYGEDWYWNDYDGYVTKESLKTTPDAQIYLMDRYRTFMNLDQEVEIIEDPKKIEKLDVALLGQCDNWLRCPTNKVTKQDVELNPYIIDNIRENTLYFQRKINELIDEINNLKENN